MKWEGWQIAIYCRLETTVAKYIISLPRVRYNYPCRNMSDARSARNPRGTCGIVIAPIARLSRLSVRTTDDTRTCQIGNVAPTITTGTEKNGKSQEHHTEHQAQTFSSLWRFAADDRAFLTAQHCVGNDVFGQTQPRWARRIFLGQ